MWHGAIVKALERRTREKQMDALEELADKLIEACATGDLPALKELGDRLDGKPAQVIQGDAENPLNMIARIERKVVPGA